MSDLWTEASFDHEAAAHEGALARAEAEFAGVFPFLAAARSEQEYYHRKAIAAMRLQRVADVSGLPAEEISRMADRHMALYRDAMARTALPEGEDPLGAVMQAPAGQYGSGPEKPGGHHEGPDFSSGYSEVPAGAPGGPPPNVVTPIFEGPQVLSQPTASARTADATQAPAGGYSTLPAGVSQSMSSPDGLGAGSSMPGVPGAGTDPVSQQVTSVARSIAASNPGLPEAECRRVARQVVGRFLRADLDTSVIRDDPNGGTGPIGGHRGGEGGGTGPVGHALEWQGAKSLMGGGGAGAAAELAEVAVL